MPERSRPDNDHDAIIQIWDMVHDLYRGAAAEGLETWPARCYVERARALASETTVMNRMAEAEKAILEIRGTIKSVGRWVAGVSASLIAAATIALARWWMYIDHLHNRLP